LELTLEKLLDNFYCYKLQELKIYNSGIV